MGLDQGEMSAPGQKRRSSRPRVASGLPDWRTILEPAHGQELKEAANRGGLNSNPAPMGTDRI